MKKFLNNNNLENGFTLVEVLLAIALTALVIGAAAVALPIFVDARVKGEAILTVEEEGALALSAIERISRAADAVVAPVAGASGASATLDIPGSSQNTVVDVSGGRLRIAEAGGSAVFLTSDRVVVSNFTVKNMTGANSPGIIRISFDLTHRNLANKSIFDWSATFVGAAELR